ncbi:hypothetical protein EST38_g10857 [Candolleomyces aberdarensis]|uniref:Ubiquitin-like domain-containing protein n=1 Tax=Candolleomyces aberdarensis TaxID=2316362 RepID=A0A4Q2D6C7_9AGAR|nr:hypothetical protein EST38_g10857 [Candolleomyces aberdarensis]
MGNILSTIRDIAIICSIGYILYNARATPPTDAPRGNSSAAPPAGGDHGLDENRSTGSPTNDEQIVEKNSSTTGVTDTDNADILDSNPSASRRSPIGEKEILSDNGPMPLPRKESMGAIGQELALQLFCGSSNFSVDGVTVNAIEGGMNIHANDLAELKSVVAEAGKVMRQLQLIRNSLPETVGHSSANAMVITDALGRTVTFPWEIVSSYEDFHETMITYFREKVGERRIKDRHYSIVRLHNGTVVNVDNWDDIRESGEQLVMSMLIDVVWVKEAEEACPKCGGTKLGTYKDQGWLVWYVANPQILWYC